MQIAKVAIISTIIHAASIASASEREEYVILLLPIFISFLPLKEANIPIIITVKVPTFMPPAVEPEPPPININTTVSRKPPLDSDALDVVANPAVRGVTALKNEAKSFSPKLKP